MPGYSVLPGWPFHIEPDQMINTYIMYRKRLVFSAACMGMLLFGIVFLSLGTISVFIQEQFSLKAIEVASLASLLPAGMLAGSVVFGPVVDRYGYKILLVICTGLIALALESIAFARSLAVLQLAFFIIGFGGGAINGGTNALAADITSTGKGAALSLLGVFYGIGALGMPLLLGMLSHITDYRTIISLLGLIVLLPLVFFVMLQFPEPKQKLRFPLTEAMALLKEPLLILMGLILFFESALEGIVGNWSTTFLKSTGLSAENALYALSCQVAIIAVARILLSGLLLKISTRTVMYLSYLFILAGCILLMRTSSLSTALMAMCCIGTGFAAGFPVILGYTGELYPRISGTAFSVVIVLALIGNTLMNYLTGILSKVWGIHEFPVFMIINLAFMVLIYSIAAKRVAKRIKI
jgi:MFS transporter, FHS family, glucose/mannose:H+ symporter